MRVLLLVGHQDGGMVHYTSQLANAASKLEDVTLFGPEGLNEGYFDSDVAIETVSHSPLAEKFGKNLMSVSRLVSKVRSHDPDLIHVLSAHPSIGAGMGFFRKYPIVSTIHDPIPPTATRKVHYLLMSLNELTKQLYFYFSDELIVHGEAMRGPLEKRGGAASKISTIQHGNYSLFTRWRDDNISEEGNTILFFGYIAEHKGVEYLFRAERKITEQVADAKIIVAGKGNLQKYRKFMGDPDRYEIHNGYIPNEKVTRLFQRASTVVLPYTSATQSGVLSIAYTFGKPVVATNVGSLPEVVDDERTGLLVPPGDAEALAGAVIELLTQDECRLRMGDRARQMAESDLSWERIARRTVTLYRSVLQENGEPT